MCSPKTVRSFFRLAVIAGVVAAPILSISASPALAQSERTRAADSTAVRNAIEQLWSEAIALFKNGDWDRVPDLFTEDGVYVAPGRPDAAGRPALRELFSAVRDLRLVNLTRDVTHFIVVGDIAMEGAFSTEEWQQVGQSTTSKAALRYLYVYRRQPSGRWLVQYLIETAAPPVPKRPS